MDRTSPRGARLVPLRDEESGRCDCWHCGEPAGSRGRRRPCAEARPGPTCPFCVRPPAATLARADSASDRPARGQAGRQGAHDLHLRCGEVPTALPERPGHGAGPAGGALKRSWSAPFGVQGRNRSSALPASGRPPFPLRSTVSRSRPTGVGLTASPASTFAS